MTDNASTARQPPDDYGRPPDEYRRIAWLTYDADGWHVSVQVTGRRDRSGHPLPPVGFEHDCASRAEAIEWAASRRPDTCIVRHRDRPLERVPWVDGRPKLDPPGDPPDV